MGKGNISGYNRDTQWTKYLIIDLVREFENLFEVLSGLVKGINKKIKHSYTKRRSLGDKYCEMILRVI